MPHCQPAPSVFLGQRTFCPRREGRKGEHVPVTLRQGLWRWLGAGGGTWVWGGGCGCCLQKESERGGEASRPSAGLSTHPALMGTERACVVLRASPAEEEWGHSAVGTWGARSGCWCLTAPGAEVPEGAHSGCRTRRVGMCLGPCALVRRCRRVCAWSDLEHVGAAVRAEEWGDSRRWRQKTEPR